MADNQTNIENIKEQKKKKITKKLYYVTVPVWKVVYLTLITFGLYLIWWFYKYWKVIALKSGKKLSPVWRSIFDAYSCFWLFPILEKYIKKHNIKICKGTTLASIYCTICLLLSFLEKLDGNNLLYLLIFCCAPIIPAIIQSKINWINKTHYPKAPKNGWGIANTLFAIPFTLWFLICLAGLFLPE